MTLSMPPSSSSSEEPTCPICYSCLRVDPAQSSSPEDDDVPPPPPPPPISPTSVSYSLTSIRLNCCNQSFHQSCLTSWRQKDKTTCPLCRAALRHPLTFRAGHTGFTPFQTSQREKRFFPNSPSSHPSPSPSVPSPSSSPEFSFDSGLVSTPASMPSPSFRLFVRSRAQRRASPIGGGVVIVVGQGGSRSSYSSLTISPPCPPSRPFRFDASGDLLDDDSSTTAASSQQSHRRVVAAAASLTTTNAAAAAGRPGQRLGADMQREFSESLKVVNKWIEA